MTDLFRGYDLTTVVDKVARADFGRKVAQLRATNAEVPLPQFDDLDPFDKRNIKQALLPLITDVLDALESDEVKPTEAKPMRVYEWTSFQAMEGGHPGYEDDVSQHHKETCTVWVLHLCVCPEAVDAVLERMAVLPETTGDYTYGDSWREWGEEAENDAEKRLAIYYDATPRRAAEIGEHLAGHAAFAALSALGGVDNAAIPMFAISTSGDYAEQLEVGA